MIPKARDLVRKCRFESGLTLAKLAEMTDHDIATIHNWESGKVEPRFKSAVEAIYAMGYEISIKKRDE